MNQKKNWTRENKREWKKKEKNGLAILERDNTNQFFFLVSTFDIFFRSHHRSFEPE